MLTWFAQELPSSCLAACVRMVLTGFNAQWTEPQVRQVVGQNRLGLTLQTACVGLAQAGAKATVYEDWSLDDLRDALRAGGFPIVGVERHPLGHPPVFHAIVVTGITSEAVEVFDPLEASPPQRYRLTTFDLAWRLAGKEALLIETPPTWPTG